MEYKKVSDSRFSNMGVILLLSATLQSVAFGNHSWNGYHWARQQNPFFLQLGGNVSGPWQSVLSTTAADWSKSTVLDTNIVSGSKKPRNCRPTAGRVEVCNDTYGNNGWLGVAQIWVSGKHITQGVVKLNDTYFNTSTYNTTAWRNLVSCQEVGHTLGLDHQDENFNNSNLGTCMDYTSNPSMNQHPNNHDYDELASIYAHVDGVTTVGSATATEPQPPAMSQIELEGRGQWGQLMRSTHGGRTEMYELDFGGGHKVFTFVIWVDGAQRGQGRQE